MITYDWNILLIKSIFFPKLGYLRLPCIQVERVLHWNIQSITRPISRLCGLIKRMFNINFLSTLVVCRTNYVIAMQTCAFDINVYLIYTFSLIFNSFVKKGGSSMLISSLFGYLNRKKSYYFPFQLPPRNLF